MFCSKAVLLFASSVLKGGVDDRGKGTANNSNNSGNGGGNGGANTGGNGGTGGGSVIPPDTVTLEEPTTAVGFPDVEGHWSAEYANDLKEKNIVFGDDKGNFNPENNVTRAEFVAMIVRALKLEQAAYTNTFDDVSVNSWYADILQTALDSGLIATDTIFRPDDNITRQEMAKVISIAAQISLKLENAEIYYSMFNDEVHVAEWAKEYVDYAFSIGLISGMEDGSFRPQNNATRGEAAAVISRLTK